MPILRNPRHERFAQGIAKGLSGKAAYVEAGYRSTGNAAEVGAAKLVRNGKIAARIAELQARQVRRLDVTVESIVAELEEARGAALAHKQLAAAVAASLGKAKLLGLIVDRAEIESVIRKPMREPGQVEQMS
ncbi:MAG: Terminase small subunit, partial [Mesorhizobium sp.]